MGGVDALTTRCTGAVLAGGRASRFGGTPKGLLAVGGIRIIDRVAEALRGATDALVVVSGAPDAGAWVEGVPAIPDLTPGEGPLGGVRSALCHAGGAVLVVAWDLPFIPVVLLRALRARGEQGGADAVLPAWDGAPDGVEPLCAWYAPGALPAMEDALRRGDRRMTGWHPAARVVRLAAREVAGLGEPRHVFANVNSPDDLTRLEPAARGAPGVTDPP